MTHTRLITNIIADFLGVETEKQRTKLETMLDMYAAALALDHYGTPQPERKPEPDTAAPAEPKQEEPAADSGAAAAAKEKKDISARLKAYREKNGLGSFDALAKVSNGALTDDDIRAMHGGVRTPIAKWRILDAALKVLEGE